MGTVRPNVGTAKQATLATEALEGALRYAEQSARREVDAREGCEKYREHLSTASAGADRFCEMAREALKWTLTREGPLWRRIAWKLPWWR
jgi:hypothetical protein